MALLRVGLGAELFAPNKRFMLYVGGYGYGYGSVRCASRRGVCFQFPEGSRGSRGQSAKPKPWWLELPFLNHGSPRAPGRRRHRHVARITFRAQGWRLKTINRADEIPAFGDDFNLLTRLRAI